MQPTLQPTLRFPSHIDVAFREAQAFQKLPPAERVTVLADLIASGLALIEHSPRREALLEQQRRHEEQWRRFHTELFRQHGY
jgi:hypothetical protein